MPDLSHSELSPEDALRLHRRLLERDASAPADVAAAFLAPLITWLEATNPSADPTTCGEAAGQAIIDFIHNPSAYHPDGLAVRSFLRMAAQRDLQNALRKERRHQRNRRDWNLVEDAPEAGKYLGRDDDPSLRLQLAEAERQAAPPEALLRGLTEVERRVLELMRQGERRTAVYAAVMGILHLSTVEQRRRVKREKDRLAKRMQRWEGGHERPA
jgi:RNA polymerase sigma-70 factor (ECF subfamily)